MIQANKELKPCCVNGSLYPLVSLGFHSSKPQIQSYFNLKLDLQTQISTFYLRKISYTVLKPSQTKRNAAFLPVSQFLTFYTLQISSQPAAHPSAPLCGNQQVYFCLFLCQIPDLCSVLLACTKLTLAQLGSGAEKPSRSKRGNLATC